MSDDPAAVTVPVQQPEQPVVEMTQQGQVRQTTQTFTQSKIHYT